MIMVLCAGGADVIMALAWMLWETVRERVAIIVVLTYMLTPKNAMCGGTSGFEASEDHEMLFVPRRPVMMSLAAYAFVCVFTAVQNPPRKNLSDPDAAGDLNI